MSNKILNFYIKSPNETKDYTIDWSSYLNTGEIISASTWTITPASPALTVDSFSNSVSAASIWISGGTHGVTYFMINKVTTSAGRIEERVLKIICQNSETEISSNC